MKTATYTLLILSVMLLGACSDTLESAPVLEPGVGSPKVEPPADQKRPTGEPQTPVDDPQIIGNDMSICTNSTGEPTELLLALGDAEQVHTVQADGTINSFNLPLPEVTTLKTETVVLAKNDRILAVTELWYVNTTYMHLVTTSLLDTDGNVKWVFTEDYGFVSEMWLADDDSVVLSAHTLQLKQGTTYVNPFGQQHRLEGFIPIGAAVDGWVPGRNQDNQIGWMHAENKEFFSMPELNGNHAIVYNGVLVGVSAGKTRPWMWVLEPGAPKAKMHPLWGAEVVNQDALEIVDFNFNGWILLAAKKLATQTNPHVVRVKVKNGHSSMEAETLPLHYPAGSFIMGCYKEAKPTIDYFGTIVVAVRDAEYGQIYALDKKAEVWEPIGVPFVDAGEMKVGSYASTVLTDVNDHKNTFCPDYQTVDEDWEGAQGTHIQVIYKNVDGWDSLVLEQGPVYPNLSAHCMAFYNRDESGTPQSISVLDLNAGATVSTLEVTANHVSWF